jgi:hypothetical protein
MLFWNSGWTPIGTWGMLLEDPSNWHFDGGVSSASDGVCGDDE